MSRDSLLSNYSGSARGISSSKPSKMSSPSVLDEESESIPVKDHSNVHRDDENLHLTNPDPNHNHSTSTLVETLSSSSSSSLSSSSPPSSLSSPSPIPFPHISDLFLFFIILISLDLLSFIILISVEFSDSPNATNEDYLEDPFSVSNSEYSDQTSTMLELPWALSPTIGMGVVIIRRKWNQWINSEHSVPYVSPDASMTIPSSPSPSPSPPWGVQWKWTLPIYMSDPTDPLSPPLPLHWKSPSTLYCVLFILFYPLFISLVQLFICRGNSTTIVSTEFLSLISDELFLSPSSSNTHILSIGYIYEFFFGVIWDIFPSPSANWGSGEDFSGCCWIILAMFEEIGWTGFLYPTLAQRLSSSSLSPHSSRWSFDISSLLTGIIWSIWHLPYVFFGGLGYLPTIASYYPGTPDTPLVFSIFMFILSITSTRVLLCKLTKLCPSLWISTWYHAAHNVFIFSFVGNVFFTPPGVHNSSTVKYNVGESGIFFVVMTVTLAVFVLLWDGVKTRRRERKGTVVAGTMEEDNESIKTVYPVELNMMVPRAALGDGPVTVAE